MTTATNAEGAVNNTCSYEPFRLARTIDSAAKDRWGASLGLKVCAFAIGITGMVWDDVAQAAPFVLFILAVAGEYFQYKFEGLRSVAQSLRRKLEYRDGFGWGLTGTDIVNVVASLPPGVKAAYAKTPPTRGTYFASKEEPGPARATENTLESAWWSKALSGAMATVCFFVMAVAILLSVLSLLVVASSSFDHSMQAGISRIVTAVLMLVISLGIGKLLCGYNSFTEHARTTEHRAEELLGTKQLDDIAALKLMHDYHMARACAPPIPDWIWDRRQIELNMLWDAYRADLISRGKIKD